VFDDIQKEQALEGTITSAEAFIDLRSSFRPATTEICAVLMPMFY